jgi:hypothetical protein
MNQKDAMLKEIHSKAAELDRAIKDLIENANLNEAEKVDAQHWLHESEMIGNQTRPQGA